MSFFSTQIQGSQLQGRIENQNAKGMPILIIQGGPGMPYDYMLSLAPLLKDNPLIFYNPIAYKEVINNNDSSLLSFKHFQQEIEHIRAHLKLSKLLLLSHSAGTIIALDYALTQLQPIEALIFISPVFSIKHYNKNMQELLLKFPENVQKTVLSSLADKEVDPIDLMEATAHFSEQHMCRLPEWPEDLIKASITINRNMQHYLWGSNDFHITGAWKNFEKRHLLHQIAQPTLLISGQHDFINLESSQYYGQYLSCSTTAEIKGASHNPHLESPQNLQFILQQFIQQLY